jgi:hypothetical protein
MDYDLPYLLAAGGPLHASTLVPIGRSEERLA